MNHEPHESHELTSWVGVNLSAGAGSFGARASSPLCLRFAAASALRVRAGSPRYDLGPHAALSTAFVEFVRFVESEPRGVTGGSSAEPRTGA